jgi:hypothetical protein
MLATWPIEELTYEGNHLVIQEVLRLLNDGTLSEEDQQKIAELGIPWQGDQVTYSRELKLQLMLSREHNSFDRLGFIIPTFGWFYAKMVVANNILNNRRGSPSSYGFARDISLLEIKGLASDKQKPYFHTVDTLLLTELESRIRCLWLWASGAETLEELKNRFNTLSGPAEICSMATRIVKERTSNTALELLDISGRNSDPVLQQVILLNRDLLIYGQLSDAIRFGDVGHFVYLVPYLAIFFKGSGSKSYAKMMLDHMQWAKYEAPDGVR